MTPTPAKSCRRAAWAHVLLLASVAVAATEIDVERLTGQPDPASRVEQLDQNLRGAFDAALAEYDEQLATTPYDAVAHTDKCRFITQFINSREYFAWYDEALALEEQCRAALQARFPEHPEVELHNLEQVYDYHAVIETGEALFAKSRTPVWTEAQIAKLHALLARAASSNGDEPTATYYALRALELDEASDVRIIAATGLRSRGEAEEAIAVLTAPIDGHNPEDGWHLLTKMQLLAEMGARDELLAVHAVMQEHAAYYDHLAVSRLLREHGAVELARLELGLAAEASAYTTDDERELFRLEYAFGSPDAALAAYESLRDFGWSEDPIGINRFSLLFRDISLPWRLRDLLGAFGAIALVCGFALCAALPAGLVHYRGLARRAKRHEAYPVGGVRLRHAWLALFAFGLASIVALYSVGPLSFVVDAFDGWWVDASGVQNARIAVHESLLSLLLLLPLAWIIGKLEPSWWGTRWSVAKSIVVGVIIGCAFRLPLIAAWSMLPDGISTLIPDDPLWQMLALVRQHYGYFTALWLLVLVAPVVEELVFRGVLLRAFSNHIGFGWANALQAVVFAALHFDAAAAPVLFALGFVCGVIARRSGGLLAPIALHATFNLFGGLLLLSGT